jgi:AhpC/TSA antioxidant enzyme
MSIDTETCAIPSTRPKPKGSSSAPTWIVWSLKAAAIYNIVWGTLVVLFPLAVWPWLGMAPPSYPQIWQCLGMIVGVYGIGYWIASGDPARHWPILLVGLLGKILGPIGFLLAATRGELPWAFGLINVMNDLIWWAPFTAALYHACQANSAGERSSPPLSLDQALHQSRSQRGHTLAELSAGQTVLVLFIRHAGCTFCREALADIAAIRQQLADREVRLAVVHMSANATADALLARYDLADVDHFSDPERRIYEAFQLSRAAWWQLFGPRVWGRGLAAILRHGQGPIDGDGFQMPGAFALRDGQIVAAYRHQTAADRPDYLQLVGAA